MLNQNIKQDNHPNWSAERVNEFIERKQQGLTPESLMPWGKYKGTSLCLFWENPTKDRKSYLDWLQATIKFRDYNYYLLDYIENHMT